MILTIARNFLYIIIIIHVAYLTGNSSADDETDQELNWNIVYKDELRAQEEAENEVAIQEERKKYNEKGLNIELRDSVKDPAEYPMTKDVNLSSSEPCWCSIVTMQKVCPNENVTFWLYNKNSEGGYQLNERKMNCIKAAPFIENKPIKVLLHGYGGNKSFTPNKEIGPFYVQKGYNVIAVDYHKVVRKPCLTETQRNIIKIAICFAKFLKKLIKRSVLNTPTDPYNYHLIGLDIGTLVAGRAALYLFNHDIMIARLTALNAYLPVFYKYPNYISTENVRFVDAIHTNVITFGKVMPFGHCNFYVNKVLWKGPCAPTDEDCNHKLAAVFFAESIFGKIPFYGYDLFRPSESAIMGENCSSTTRGIFFVETNSKPPYAKGCKSDMEDGGTDEDDTPTTLIKINKTFSVKI